MLKQAEEAFGNQLNDYLRDIVGRLKSFYPDEFRLLGDLIARQNDDLQFFASEAPILVDHLIGYGLIARHGDHFDVTFDAIARAVKSLDDGIQPPDLAIEEKWSSMVVRRNKIEQAIRSSMYVQARSLSAAEWDAVLTASLSKVRRERLVSTAPSVLFSKESSPLYLTDLMGLIGHASVLPYLADKKSLVRHLSVINNLRNDAHAKDISDVEFARLSDACEEVERDFLI